MNRTYGDPWGGGPSLTVAHISATTKLVNFRSRLRDGIQGCLQKGSFSSGTFEVHCDQGDYASLIGLLDRPDLTRPWPLDDERTWSQVITPPPAPSIFFLC